MDKLSFQEIFDRAVIAVVIALTALVTFATIANCAAKILK